MLTEHGIPLRKRNNTGLETNLALAFIATVLLASAFNIKSGKDQWSSSIASDGKGYYAYLPAIFIYHDLNFGFYDQIENNTYFNPNRVADYRIIHNGKYADKYFAGTALAMLPFFAGGRFAAQLFNYPDDGYSKPFQIAIALAAIFYTLLGCFFLHKILAHFEIGDLTTAIILVALTFGTNLYYYTVIEPSMSHVYSFALVSFFLFATFRYFETLNGKYLILLSALLGWIILIRPVNSIMLLSLPFAAPSFNDFLIGAKKILLNKTLVATSALLFICMLAIQPFLYKMQTGSFWLYSYGDEHLDFFHPQILNVLFSYKKGLFVYTPLLFVSLVGFYFLFKINSYRSVCLLGFLAIVTYMISSWEVWWYGGSFSLRPFIDYYMFFGILLALPLEHLQRGKPIFLSLLILIALVCQIQTYQYRYYYIHWENMTKQKYWEVFLRVDKLIQHKK